MKMKIGYLSDIHIDFYVKPNKEKLLENFVCSLKPAYYDILIIAGDIGHYNHQNIALLRFFKKYTANLVVTLGNHEFYLVSDRMKKKYRRSSLQKVEEFKKLCQTNDIIFLDMKVIDIGGVRIGGGYLWYDLQKIDKEFWKKHISDAKYVYLDYQAYTKQALHALRQISDCHIFISHIPQTKVSPLLPPHFDTSYLPFYEEENIAILQDKGVRYHIYGHNHTQEKFLKEGIWCLTCSLGYPNENLPKKIDSFTL